jgi:hypothetical protein
LRSFPALAAALLLLLLAAGCASPTRQAAPPAAIGFSDPASEGARAFRIVADGPISYDAQASYGWAADDYRPVEADLVTAEHVLPVLRGPAYDGAHDGEGDGVAYAGVAGEQVAAPTLLSEAPAPVTLRAHRAIDAREAVLVVAWSGVKGGVSCRSAWPGATVTPLAGASATSFEAQDTQAGARAGTPATLVCLNATFPLDPQGGALLASLTLDRGDQGVGRLEARGEDGWTRDVSLSGSFDPLGGGLGSEVAHVAFTRAQPTDLALNYTGNGHSTQLMGLVVRLPAGAAPPNLWEETPFTRVAARPAASPAPARPPIDAAARPALR